MTNARVIVVGLGAVAGLLALAGCPQPRMPEGAPPEYEDPARPSWLEGGAPAPTVVGPPATDAGAADGG